MNSGISNSRRLDRALVVGKAKTACTVYKLLGGNHDEIDRTNHGI